MAALALGAVIYTVASPDGLLRLGKLKREVIELSSENDKLQNENDQTRQKIESLREDKDVIERAVREDLGYLKPDEVVFHFAPSETATTGQRH